MNLEGKLLPDGEQSPSRAEIVKWLVPGIAHELNNIMVGVVGFVGLAQRRIEDTPRALQDLGTVATEARRASALLHDLLLFTGRSFSGAVRDTDVLEMLESTVRLAQYHLRSAGIDVELDVPRDVPDMPLHRRSIQEAVLQVIRLLGAARHASHETRSLDIIAGGYPDRCYVDLRLGTSRGPETFAPDLIHAVEDRLAAIEGHRVEGHWLDADGQSGSDACTTLRLFL